MSPKLLLALFSVAGASVLSPDVPRDSPSIAAKCLLQTSKLHYRSVSEAKEDSAMPSFGHPVSFGLGPQLGWIGNASSELLADPRSGRRARPWLALGSYVWERYAAAPRWSSLQGLLPSGSAFAAAKAAGTNSTAGSDKSRLVPQVSVTMYCVMLLTVLGVLVHTSSAFMQSVDDLSLARERSFSSEVLEVACRSNQLLPVLCCLFVAMRLSLLLSTHGKGETAPWVQACMLAATAGAVCNLLLVVLAAWLFDREASSRFIEATGVAGDAFLRLERFNFARRWAFLLPALQFVVLLCLFGGTFGVAVGTILSTVMCHSSSGFACTAVGSVAPAALLLLFTLLVLRLTRRGLPEEDGFGDGGDSVTRAVTLAAARVASKARMLAVLCLAAQLRQQNYASAISEEANDLVNLCFPLAVGLLYFEFLLTAGSAAVVGGAAAGEGEEEEDMDIRMSRSWSVPCRPEKDEWPPGRTRSSSSCSGDSPRNYVLKWSANILAGVGYIVAVAGAIAVRRLRHDGTATSPLSPTMSGVVVLAVMFYLVQLVHWIAGFLRGRRSSGLRDALRAASHCADICPMLCVLFLCCRMRALQITQQRGAPQWWAQDCIYLCVVAAVLDILGGLCLPFFFKEVSVDADGKQRCEVGGGESLVGASLATLVRYSALLGLHLGVVGICISALTITPEAARMGELVDEEKSWAPVCRTVLWAFLIVLAGAALSSAKVVGFFVKVVVESIDRVYLNADITVEQALCSIWRGQVLIRHLVVENPLDSDFLSDYLLKVRLICVKVNIWRLIKSFGMALELKELIIDGVKIKFELGHDGGPSNVAMLLEYIEGSAEEDAKREGAKLEEATPREGATPQEAKSEEATPRPGEPPQPPPDKDDGAPSSGFQMHVGHVLVKNATAQIIHPEVGQITRLDLGTINKDFSKGSTWRNASGVVLAILGSVLSATLKAAIGSASLAGYLIKRHGARAAGAVAGAVADSFSEHCCAPMSGCLPRRGPGAPKRRSVNTGGGVAATSSSAGGAGKR